MEKYKIRILSYSILFFLTPKTILILLTSLYTLISIISFFFILFQSLILHCTHHCFLVLQRKKSFLFTLYLFPFYSIPISQKGQVFMDNTSYTNRRAVGLFTTTAFPHIPHPGSTQRGCECCALYTKLCS